jgi:hypothetical protein
MRLAQSRSEERALLGSLRGERYPLVNPQQRSNHLRLHPADAVVFNVAKIYLRPDGNVPFVVVEWVMSEPESKRRMAVLFLLLLGPLVGAVFISYALHDFLGWDPYEQVCLEKKKSGCGPSVGFWAMPILVAVITPVLALYEWLRSRRGRNAP